MSPLPLSTPATAHLPGKLQSENSVEQSERLEIVGFHPAQRLGNARCSLVISEDGVRQTAHLAGHGLGR